MQTTEALTTVSFANLLRETDAIGMFVYGLLAFMSIVSRYFMIIKFVQVARIRTRSNQVASWFWKTAPEQGIAFLDQQSDREP